VVQRRRQDLTGIRAVPALSCLVPLLRRPQGTRFYKEAAFDEVSEAEQKRELMAKKAAMKKECSPSALPDPSYLVDGIHSQLQSLLTLSQL
jgi:hypothetical protein